MGSDMFQTLFFREAFEPPQFPQDLGLLINAYYKHLGDSVKVPDRK